MNQFYDLLVENRHLNCNTKHWGGGAITSPSVPLFPPVLTFIDAKNTIFIYWFLPASNDAVIYFCPSFLFMVSLHFKLAIFSTTFILAIILWSSIVYLLLLPLNTWVIKRVVWTQNYLSCLGILSIRPTYLVCTYY